MPRTTCFGKNADIGVHAIETNLNLNLFFFRKSKREGRERATGPVLKKKKQAPENKRQSKEKRGGGGADEQATTVRDREREEKQIEPKGGGWGGWLIVLRGLGVAGWKECHGSPPCPSSCPTFLLCDPSLSQGFPPGFLLVWLWLTSTWSATAQSVTKSVWVRVCMLCAHL